MCTSVSHLPLCFATAGSGPWRRSLRVGRVCGRNECHSKNLAGCCSRGRGAVESQAHAHAAAVCIAAHSFSMRTLPTRHLGCTLGTRILSGRTGACVCCKCLTAGNYTNMTTLILLCTSLCLSLRATTCAQRAVRLRRGQIFWRFCEAGLHINICWPRRKYLPRSLIESKHNKTPSVPIKQMCAMRARQKVAAPILVPPRYLKSLHRHAPTFAPADPVSYAINAFSIIKNC